MTSSGHASTPIPLHPTWPMVRCDACRTVYEMPVEKRLGIIVGDCPKCGSNLFSTVIDNTTIASVLE